MDVRRRALDTVSKASYPSLFISKSYAKTPEQYEINFIRQMEMHASLLSIMDLYYYGRSEAAAKTIHRINLLPIGINSWAYV